MGFDMWVNISWKSNCYIFCTLQNFRGGICPPWPQCGSTPSGNFHLQRSRKPLDFRACSNWHTYTGNSKSAARLLACIVACLVFINLLAT